MKLVSRAQWGARAYRQPSGATTYSRARRGVKLHYLGSAYSDRTHDRCDDYIRQIQAQHMDENGWSDIGYSFLVCTHGYVYEGRGLRRRNSANGNTTLNEQDYAVCLLVGSSGLTKPTDAQLHGVRDAIDYCRKEGPAGSWLGGHRDGYATTCPGDAIYAWVQRGAPRPNTPTPPKEDEDPMAGMTPAQIADAVLNTDGVFGVPEHWRAHNPKNKEWKFSAVIVNLGDHVRAVEAKLDAQKPVELTDTQLAALAEKVAAHPTLAEQIAEKVAAKLANRLAE